MNELDNLFANLSMFQTPVLFHVYIKLSVVGRPDSVNGEVLHKKSIDVVFPLHTASTGHMFTNSKTFDHPSHANR